MSTGILFGGYLFDIGPSVVHNRKKSTNKSYADATIWLGNRLNYRADGIIQTNQDGKRGPHYKTKTYRVKTTPPQELPKLSTRQQVKCGAG